MRFSPWLTLTLTAGVAFGAAWGLASLQKQSAEARGVSSLPGGGQEFKGQKTGTETAAAKAFSGSTASAGVMQDALVRRALEGADLAAGVKEIMARQNEDHCADTRLVCLVEQLPAARLTELPALLDQFTGNDFVTKFVLSTWAKRDAAGALAWVQSRPALSANGMQAFLSGWTRAAPEAALAWVDAQPFSTGSAPLRTALVETMAEKDPAAALELMQSRGWSAQNPQAVLKLLRNWGGRDPGAALAGLRTFTAEMGMQFQDSTAETDPFGPARNQSFQTMLRALLHGAFERNPADAAALAAQLTPDELSEGLSAVAGEVLARDPAACEALFVPQPDATARRMLVALAEDNANFVLSQIGRITDKSLQAEVLAAATSSYHSSEDPPLPAEPLPALRTVLAGIENEADRAKITENLCTRTAATAPAFAAELWQGMTEEQKLIRGSFHRFFQDAATADPQIALEAFSGSSPGIQQLSLKSLCSGLAVSAPEMGLSLVLQQSEPELRAASAATLFAYWAQSSPEAALAALEQNAASLDLQAVEQQLGQAAHFGNHGFSTSETVSSTALKQKIQELTGSPAVSGP